MKDVQKFCDVLRGCSAISIDATADGKISIFMHRSRCSDEQVKEAAR